MKSIARIVVVASAILLEAPAIAQQSSSMSLANSPCTVLKIPGGQKITCPAGEISFSHDSSGSRDALATDLKFQFTITNGSSDSVEALIQGAGQGVSWELTLQGIELIYTDPTGIVRSMGPAIQVQPNVFRCRASDAIAFSGKGAVSRQLVLEWLQWGKIMMKPSASLRTGIPGAGC